MDTKYSERMDGLARDIQQQKMKFHAAIDTGMSDLQKQIEALHVRFEKGGVEKAGGGRGLSAKEAKTESALKTVSNYLNRFMVSFNFS